jgi:hypothetical protein
MAVDVEDKVHAACARVDRRAQGAANNPVVADAIREVRVGTIANTVTVYGPSAQAARGTLAHEPSSRAATNNYFGTSFYKPDPSITLVDPHRAGHEVTCDPGESSLILAGLPDPAPDGLLREPGRGQRSARHSGERQFLSTCFAGLCWAAAASARAARSSALAG